MEIKELNDFAQWENNRIETMTGKSNEELVHPSISKIAEEYGEFVNEFLKSQGIQRKEKLKDPETTKKEMHEEFADLILVSFLVANRLNINIEEELKKKMEKVKLRVY